VAGPKSVIEALVRSPRRSLGTVPDYPGIKTPPPSPDYPRVAVFKTMESKVVSGC